MASLLKVDSLTGVTTAGSISVTGEGNSTTTNLQQGLTKQWCALNGTGTIAILDSFNVSSVVDGGTGTYGFVCTSNFSSINHTPTGEVLAVGNFSSIDLSSEPETTGTDSFRCFNIGGTGIDSAFVSYQSCGDLA